MESYKEEIPFSDLKEKLNEGKTSTDLCIKSTDRHKFLRFTLSHPNHTKRSTVCSNGLQVKRISSKK